MTLPLSVPSDGTLAIKFVQTLTSPAAPKLATEINAVTSEDLDVYITGDGFQPTGEQETVADERVASTQTFEQPGRKTESLTVVYVHSPDDAPNNQAYVALAEGTSGYIVARWGVPRTQVWAVGDLVDVWPIKAGVARKNFNGANSVHTATQRLFVTNQVQRDVAVVT